MQSIRILTLALVPALAVAAPAFAQDSTSTGTAADKRFAVVGGIAHIEPSDPGQNLKVDGGPAPTLSASWYATENFAVELWGAADKFNHRVRDRDLGKLGTVEQQPIALSGQYHFGQAGQVFRPFVGLGYYESNFSNEDVAGLGGVATLGTAKGAIGTVGLDMNINETWFARTDVRYMHSRPEVRVAGQGTGEELKLDPWTVGVGIGARF